MLNLVTKSMLPSSDNSFLFFQAELHIVQAHLEFTIYPKFLILLPPPHEC